MKKLLLVYSNRAVSNMHYNTFSSIKKMFDETMDFALKSFGNLQYKEKKANCEREKKEKMLQLLATLES